MTAVPRVVVSAPSSGHGKTAVAVGLLAAYTARGLSAAGFKIGPDYTDAAYLGLACGRPGRNLDTRLVGATQVAPLFMHGAAGADVAVVEGTMGLFDSLTGRGDADSTASVAAALRAPVVLVVDVGAMGQSVAALMHGFRAYDELLWLGGVILNRVASDRHEQLLREALDDIGVPVFGALRRRDLPASLPSRLHGVVPVVQRTVEAVRGVRRLGEAVAARVDLDRLLALARSAPRSVGEAWSPAVADPDTRPAGHRPVVALAGGPGGSYSYAEHAELLTAAGATVVLFDPLRDETLPAGTDALIVGGGLPESYAEDLSANRRLCDAVSDLARSGRPVIAEGAGLLWLTRAFDGRPMCGVLDAIGTTSNQFVVGYREATARAATPVAQLGARLVGYKQHCAVVTPRAGQTPAWTWRGGAPEGFVWRRVHASQLILHWAGAPEIASRLVAAVLPPVQSQPVQPQSATGPAATTQVAAAPDQPADQVGDPAPASVPVVPVQAPAAAADAGPAQPAATESASVQPAPTESASVQPAPTESASTGPVAGPDGANAPAGAPA